MSNYFRQTVGKNKNKIGVIMKSAFYQICSFIGNEKEIDNATITDGETYSIYILERVKRYSKVKYTKHLIYQMYITLKPEQVLLLLY